MKTSSKLSALVVVASLVCAVLLVESAGARTTPRVSDESAGYAAAAAQFAAAQSPALAGATSLMNTLADCFPGAHTLSKFGDRVYPEMGNGGYTSLHTDVYLELRRDHELVPAGHARRPPADARRSA